MIIRHLLVQVIRLFAVLLVSLCAGATAQAAIIDDDFEPYTINNAGALDTESPWTVGGNTFATPGGQSPIGVSGGDSQGVTLNSVNNVDNSLAQGITVGSAATLYVQFDVNIQSGAVNPQFTLLDNSGFPPELQFHIRGGSGTPQNRNSSNFADLPTTIADNTWYRYTFTIDPENTAGLNSYDLRIQSLADDSTDDVHTNIPFRVDTTTYTRIAFSFNTGNSPAGQYFVDNVLVTTNANELIYPSVVPEPPAAAVLLLGAFCVFAMAVYRRHRL